MSEPTLHERLREAGNQPYEGEHPMYTYHGITLTDLVAIQKQIEDAATATLRAELAEMENDRDRWKVRRHDGGRLWSKLRDASRRVYHDSTPNFSTQFALTVAEVNAIEWELLGAYDADDRAGETSSGPTNDHAGGSPLSDRGPGIGAGEASEGTGTPTEREGLAAPSPTDAADARDSVASDLVAYVQAMIEDEDGTITEEDRAKLGDFIFLHAALGLSGDDPTDAAEQDATLQARPDTERINDLVARADVATSRLDMHMQRMDDFQHWREGVDRSLREIRANHAQMGDGIRADWAANQERMDGLGKRLDALEAARTPVPEVTDEVMTAYWTASGTKDSGESIKRGLAAALALAAGGAK